MKKLILCLLVIVMFGSASAQIVLDGLFLEQMSMQEYGSSGREMLAYDNYWIVGGSAGGLSIIDVSNVENPELVSTILPMQSIRSFDLSYPYLFVGQSGSIFAGDNDYLCVFDLTDVQNPIQIYEAESLEDLYAIVVINDYLYIADRYSNEDLFQVLNIQNPANPFVVHVQQDAGIENYDVQGDLAVFTTHDNGIQFYNVEFPDNPVLQPSDWISGHGTVIKLHGSALYAANRGDHFRTYDISDLENITITYELILEGNSNLSLAIIDNSLILSESSSYMDPNQITYFDITDPLNPAFIDSHPASIEMVTVHGNDSDYIMGDIFYDTSNDHLYAIYDIAGITNPSLVSSFGYSFVPYIMLQRNNVFYLGSSQGMVVLDWSDPENPHDALIWRGKRVNDMELIGDYLYVSAEEDWRQPGDTGLYIFDVTDPLNPVEVYYLPRNSMYEIEANEEVAYISMNGVIGVYDVTDPVNPVIIGSVPGWNEADRLVLDGDVIYVIENDGGDYLRSYSIEDPTQPLLLHHLYINYPESYSWVYEITVENGILAVAGAYEFFNLYDVSDPTSLSHLTSPNISYNAYGVDIEGNYLSVATWDGNLYVYDISNPANPSLAGGLTGAYHCQSALIIGSKIYAAIGSKVFRLDAAEIMGQLVPPSGLFAENLGVEVQLTWQEPDYGPPAVLEGYNVYRGLDQVGYSETTSFADILPSSGTYSYSVTAVYQNGESIPTDPAIVDFFASSSLTLDPYEPYLQVPPIGGNVYFHASISNDTNEPLTVDAWSTAVYQSGNPFPIDQYTVLIDPLETETWTWLSIEVPASAPAGTYTFTGHVGAYPDFIEDQDSFQVTKLGEEQAWYDPEYGSVVDIPVGWAVTGWDVPNPAPFAASDVVSETVLPSEFALSTYPNPFNDRATISLSLPEAGDVRVSVYDVTGRLVTTLRDGRLNAGLHRLKWDATGQASGVYFLSVQHSGSVQTIRKMALVR
jgi:hypothetical protein